MRKLTFPFVMKSCAAIAGLLTLTFILINRIFPRPWLVSCAVTFGTFFYHFAMRLLVGALVPARFNPKSVWFQPRPWEQKLYKRLKLKKWKDHLPTYNPTLFSTAHYSMEEIVLHTCQAEVVHEVIALCSFLPLLFSLFFGTFPVFLITSILSAALDALFVLLQRYNRPRLMRLLEKKARRANHNFGGIPT